MFQFEFKAAESLSFRALKAALPGAALALGLALAPAANAATYVLQNGVLEGSRTLKIAGIGNARATAMQFDGFIDGPGSADTPFTNLVAFCVDVYHQISTGNYNPNLTYTDDNELEHDSNWNSLDRQFLSNQEILHVSRLVNYGTNVFYNASTATNALKNARRDELAAVQGAIWEVVSGRNVTWVSGGNGVTINTRINALSGATYNSAFNLSYGHVHSGITLITPFKNGKVYPHKDLTQAFAFAAVPEPQTWALMIGGFGLAGGVLRAQRRKGAVIQGRV